MYFIMTFHTRNAYYLQLSSNNVLPLYLYLDEQHLGWMSDKVLQYVLADLRPLIVPKLQAEVDIRLRSDGPAYAAKMGTVDVKRGDFYQFAYFLRKVEPHSLLIKIRSFSTAPSQPAQTETVSNSNFARIWKGKRKSTATSENSAKGRKIRKTKRKARVDHSDEELAISSEEDFDMLMPHSPQFIGVTPRRSGRAKKLVAGGYRQDKEGDADIVDPHAGDDVYMTPAPPVLAQKKCRESPDAAVKEEGQDLVGPPNAANSAPPEKELIEAGASEIELVVDEEETKPKPLLQLQYQGFNILGNCLCVVVEPWPYTQAVSRAPSVAPSVSCPDIMLSGQFETMHREQTPLFLPDPDRGTPAPFIKGVLPPVPLFRNPIDQETDDIDDDALMKFSQVLNYAGDQQGGLEDDDEIDGAVFFGDADEAREL